MVSYFNCSDSWNVSWNDFHVFDEAVVEKV